MRNFVSSIILSMIMTLFSVAVIFLLQAPLLTFVYYGFFTDNSLVLGNIIGKISNSDGLTITILALQILFSVIFIVMMFSFIKKVIFVFLKNEKLVRPYYFVFFFCMTILPVLIIYLSVLLKVNFWILSVVIEFLFNVLTTILIIFAKKILPETTNTEYRKYLFSKGNENE